MNERQLGAAQGARRLAARQRRQVPLRAARARRAGPARVGRRRHRPLRRRAAPGADEAGDRGDSRTTASRSTSGRSRASTRARTRDARRAVARRRGPRGRRLRAPRPRRVRRQGRPLAAPGGARRGLRRLRDRPLDLVGRAEGLPRRSWSAAPPRSRSPTTTCASCRSTTTRSRARASDARAGGGRAGGRRPRGVRRRAAATGRGRPPARSCASPTATRSACGWLGREERVRYIGIDTPEIDLRRVLRGQARRSTSGSCRREVRLELDARSATATAACSPTSTRDVLVNAELLREGYAQPLTCPERPLRGPLRGSPRCRREAGAVGILLVIRCPPCGCGRASRDRRGVRRGDRGGPRAARAARPARGDAHPPAAHREGPQARHDALRLLVLTLIATAVVVTIAMFQTLYYVMG